MTNLVQHILQNSVFLANFDTKGTLSDSIEHAAVLGVQILGDTIRQIKTQQTGSG
jgi:hypothetical protein